MYKDIGNTIKRLTIILCILFGLGSFITGLVLAFVEDFIFIILMLGGPFLAWIISVYLYGFGEMVDNISKLVKEKKYEESKFTNIKVDKNSEEKIQDKPEIKNVKAVEILKEKIQDKQEIKNVKTVKISEETNNINIEKNGIRVIHESEFELKDSKIKYNNCFYNLSGIKNIKIFGNSVLFTLLGSDYKVIITSGYARVKEIFNLLNQYVDKEE